MYFLCTSYINDALYRRAFKCVYRYDCGIIMSPLRDMLTRLSPALHLWIQIESVFCSNLYKARSPPHKHIHKYTHIRILAELFQDDFLGHLNVVRLLRLAKLPNVIRSLFKICKPLVTGPCGLHDVLWLNVAVASHGSVLKIQYLFFPEIPYYNGWIIY